MTKDELLRAIVESPLSEEDCMELVKALLHKALADAVINMGMDLANQYHPGLIEDAS